MSYRHDPWKTLQFQDCLSNDYGQPGIFLCCCPSASVQMAESLNAVEPDSAAHHPTVRPRNHQWARLQIAVGLLVFVFSFVLILEFFSLPSEYDPSS